MNAYVTFAILVAAGIAVVLQNLLLVRITQSVSTVLITLVLNSCMGLILLVTALLLRSGKGGVVEVVGAIRPWTILPGFSEHISSLPGSLVTRE